MAKVLVTGATGFIAAHTIVKLLERGHEVRGTARSAAKADTLNASLSAYAGRPVEVPLVAANLSSDEGWDEAVEGMDYVQHIASPIPVEVPRNPDELIVPAREGALRVLRAAKAADVERVVMTSSVAAVAYGWGDDRPESFTEAHWSNSDDLKGNTPYTRSKTIAERAAWDFMAEEGGEMELVTINPGAVLGPVMSGDFSASLEILTQLLGGKLPALPRVGYQIVDVRDVAEAHVLAMESDVAAGKRFIVAGDFYWFEDVADLLRERMPEFAEKLPKGRLPNFVVRLLAPFNPPVRQILPELGRRRFASSDQAKAMLGWSPRSSEDAILDGARSLVQHGAV